MTGERLLGAWMIAIDLKVGRTTFSTVNYHPQLQIHTL